MIKRQMYGRAGFDLLRKTSHPGHLKRGRIDHEMCVRTRIQNQIT
jgi:hypothetical protein